MVVARARQRNDDFTLDPSGSMGHNQHAVGQYDGLLDVVGHEHHRLLNSASKLRKKLPTWIRV